MASPVLRFGTRPIVLQIGDPVRCNTSFSATFSKDFTVVRPSTERAPARRVYEIFEREAMLAAKWGDRTESSFLSLPPRARSLHRLVRGSNGLMLIFWWNERIQVLPSNPPRAAATAESVADFAPILILATFRNLPGVRQQLAAQQQTSRTATRRPPCCPVTREAIPSASRGDACRQRLGGSRDSGAPGGSESHLERAAAEVQGRSGFVNIAKGSLGDEEAVAEGRLVGAGMDVHENEPPVTERLKASELAPLTSHHAGGTLDAHLPPPTPRALVSFCPAGLPKPWSRPSYASDASPATADAATVTMPEPNRGRCFGPVAWRVPSNKHR
ncbi:unnamed protein product [Diplocarpon coronariae]